MSHRIAVVAALALLGAGIAGCGTSTRPVADDSTIALGSSRNSDPFGAMLHQARDLGPVSPTLSVSVLLTLKNPNSGREAADLAAMYRPHSRSFGHFKTLKQVDAAYGPPVAEVRAVSAALRHAGMRGSWQRGNSWMVVRGPAAAVDRFFHVSIHQYRARNGVRFAASPRGPAVPAVVRREVSGAGRISSYFPVDKAAIPASGLSPVDLRVAYDMQKLHDQGIDGRGETVAVMGLDGFAQSDFDTFTKRFGLPPLRPTIAVGPSLKPGGEAEMDAEVIHEIAPAARIVFYNVDFDALSNASDQQVFQAFVDLQNKMVNANPHGILSESWSFCDATLGRDLVMAHKNVYDKAAVLGESVFAASGDSGAFECLKDADRGTPPSERYVNVSVPASLPGVTGVGGTRLSVLANRQWYNETVWEDPARTIATGGGISRYLSQPSWQTGPGASDNTLNLNHMRMVPDVAADADPGSGATIYTTGSWDIGNGTSQATPIWAGMTALLNQYLKSKGLHSAGFLNPALYALASTPQSYPPFHDVLIGGNMVYPAGPGYDMSTGVGTPNAWNLARDLVRYLRSGSR